MRTPAQENLFVTQSSQDALSQAVSEVAGAERRTGGQEESGQQGQSETAAPKTQRKTRAAKGGMASAPRRRSQSPQKQDPKISAPESSIGASGTSQPAPVEPTDPPNPFQKRGLRRSPPPGAPRPEITQPAKAPEPVAQSIEEPREPDPMQGRPTEPAEPPNPFKKGGLRRSDPTPTAPPSAPPQPSQPTREEPDLPPTPTQLGIPDPVVTTPPTGIHNTPSKRRKRPRDTKPKPSPLKPRDPPPLPPAEPAEEARPPKRRREEAASRHLVPPDPHAEKKRRRARLQAELEQLEADVALAERETERLRKAAQAGSDAQPPANADAILDLLVRAVQPPPPADPPPRPASVFARIGLFLPFSKRERARAAPAPAAVEEEQQQLPSTLPLRMENPLPHLQIFTPLTFSCTTSIVAPTPGGDGGGTGVLQRHSIAAAAPGGLFCARVAVVVDAASLAVVRLQMEAVDASAEAELGAWVRERAWRERDVGKLFWAMGGWVESAVRRARFWCAVGEEMGGQEKGGGEEGRERRWTSRELLPHMRRRSLAVQVHGGVEVVFEWQIGFDWTGEAEQRISASARVPASCKCHVFSGLTSFGTGLMTCREGTR